MNYSREKLRQSLLEVEIYIGFPCNFFALFFPIREAYNISLTDTAMDRFISMVVSALTLRQLRL